MEISVIVCYYLSNKNNSIHNKCFLNYELEAFILNERIEGVKEFDINATPTLILNNQKFEKTLSFKNLKKAIEKLL